MHDTLRRMTLQDLLKQHGILTLREFTKKAGLASRQQAWSLWRGEAGVGKVMAKRLHERLQIPLEELLEVDPVPYTKPRKRPVPRRSSDQRDVPNGM
jgi:transcriptional regulator with XRE-family HTH domain